MALLKKVTKSRLPEKFINFPLKTVPYAIWALHPYPDLFL
jgi:hypothetical protein